jgi:spore coat polysaccharide biosynthesis protein SpsF
VNRNKDYRIVAVVQARMSSKRLPGKVMMNFLGKPMLGHLCDRLSRCAGIDDFIVATSDLSIDDEIDAYISSRGINCYRGDLNDVAARIIGAAELMAADALVRVSGDSPLLDPEIVRTSVVAFRDHNLDLVTNVQQRTFPRGQSVEVVSLSALRSAWIAGMSTEECEHVTTYFYKHPDLYSILNLTHEPACGDIQLSIDTIEDFNRVKLILGRLGKPYCDHSLVDILRVLKALSLENQCND